LLTVFTFPLKKTPKKTKPYKSVGPWLQYSYTIPYIPLLSRMLNSTLRGYWGQQFPSFGSQLWPMVSTQSVDKNEYLRIKNGHLFIARLIDLVMDILYDTSLIMSNCDQPFHSAKVWRSRKHNFWDWLLLICQ